jgi:hypothetical protein
LGPTPAAVGDTFRHRRLTACFGRPIPADCITKVTAIGPAGSPDCARWLQFLNETTGADAEFIRFLQQWCGYVLTGLTREHALVFVYGPGGNGKSVFLNVVTWILRQYAATSSMDTFTASKGDRHLTEIAKLCGARLVTVPLPAWLVFISTKAARAVFWPALVALEAVDPDEAGSAEALQKLPVLPIVGAQTHTGGNCPQGSGGGRIVELSSDDRVRG